MLDQLGIFLELVLSFTSYVQPFQGKVFTYQLSTLWPSIIYLYLILLIRLKVTMHRTHFHTTDRLIMYFTTEVITSNTTISREFHGRIFPNLEKSHLNSMMISPITIVTLKSCSTSFLIIQDYGRESNVLIRERNEMTNLPIIEFFS